MLGYDEECNSCWKEGRPVVSTTSVVWPRPPCRQGGVQPDDRDLMLSPWQLLEGLLALTPTLSVHLPCTQSSSLQSQPSGTDTGTDTGTSRSKRGSRTTEPLPWQLDRTGAGGVCESPASSGVMLTGPTFAPATVLHASLICSPYALLLTVPKQQASREAPPKPRLNPHVHTSGNWRVGLESRHQAKGP